MKIDKIDLVTSHEEYIELKDNIDRVCDRLEVELENYKVLENSIKTLNNESIDSISYKVANLSYITTLNNMGYSNEEISLEDNKHEMLNKVAKIIQDTYKALMNTFTTLFYKVLTSVDILSDTYDDLIDRVEKLDIEESYIYLTEEEIGHVYKYFGTIIKMSNNVHTNDDLCRLLIKSNPSISSPKITSPLTNIVQTGLPRINIDKIVFTKEVIARSSKSNIGINQQLNEYFYTKLPEQVQEKTNKEQVMVVEYYGNRCGGIIYTGNKFHYTLGNLTYNDKLTAFREPPTKSLLVNVLRMGKALCLRIEGYKDLVNKDIEDCKKIVFNFNKVDRVIDDENKDTSVFSENISFIKEFANSVPKVGNANIANYYLMLKNILHYSQLCYTKLK